MQSQQIIQQSKTDLKIAILAVRDTGGTAYTLAHAVNRVAPQHKAISIRGVNNYINYPTHVEMAEHTRTAIREAVYKADVVMFLGAMLPFYESLHLQRKLMVDKKKLLLCMGSEWRYGRDQLRAQANELLGDYKIVLGGADMFMPLTVEHPETHEVKEFPATDESEVAYLPVVRSFQDIERYKISKEDAEALGAFAVPKRKVVFIHAPTSENNKGSVLFYRVATRAMQACKTMTFSTVKMQTWASTLTRLSQADVLLDQAPQFPTAYGALSVEAGIFHLPAFSQIHPDCRAFIKRHTGLDTPHIIFESEDDLFEKMVALASQEKLRRYFGDLNYQYCKELHDEKPVVNRLLKIIEDM